MNKLLKPATVFLLTRKKLELKKSQSQQNAAKKQFLYTKMDLSLLDLKTFS